MSMITSGRLHSVDLVGFDDQSICVSVVFQNQCSVTQRWKITAENTCSVDIKTTRAKWANLHSSLESDEFYTALSSLCIQSSGPVVTPQESKEVAIEGFSDALKGIGKLFASRPKFHDEELFGKYSVNSKKLLDLLNKTVLDPKWLDDVKLNTGEFSNLEAINRLDFNGRIGTDGVIKTVKDGVDEFRKHAKPYYDAFLNHAETVSSIHEDTVKACNNDEDHNEKILEAAAKKIKALPKPMSKFKKCTLMGNVVVTADDKGLHGKKVGITQSPIPLLSREECADVGKLIVSIIEDSSLEDPFMPYPDYDTEPEFWQAIEPCYSSDEYGFVVYFQNYDDWHFPYAVSMPHYQVVDSLARLLITSIKN